MKYPAMYHVHNRYFNSISYKKNKPLEQEMTKVNTLQCVEAKFTGEVPGFDKGHYQKQYYYSNGYGASVVWNRGSYGADDGLFEVAVLDASGCIVYDTPVTSDVCGYLNFGQVADVLQQIRNLPCRNQ